MKKIEKLNFPDESDEKKYFVAKYFYSRQEALNELLKNKIGIVSWKDEKVYTTMEENHTNEAGIKFFELINSNPCVDFSTFEDGIGPYSWVLTVTVAKRDYASAVELFEGRAEVGVLYENVDENSFALLI